ncbi:MAG: DUF4276 family protein [Candidatus Competibacteraceae bacterium]|nr:DUF4276 family protein [Candidatus Competibacteraceae bacterium]
MIRLGISVEGTTEREFVNRVLAPYLAGLQVYTQPIAMNGSVSLDRIRTEMRPLLCSFDWVTTLYDLYAFKKRSGRSAEQLETAMQSIVKGFGQGKLVPYVQIYEFEALMFAGPEETAEELGNPALADQIRDAVQQCGSPEAVNDGYETCPSRRLKRLFPHYNKKLHGPVIAQRIGLERLRQACPRFGQWLAKLEDLS